MSLYELCIKRPVFTTMLIMSLVVLGAASWLGLGIDLFPKVDLPTITITTRLQGASPEEIETQITKRIEEVVNTINGIDELRSSTIEGQSQVFATFLLEKDINIAANEVRDKVSAIVSFFPPGTDAPIIEKFDPDSSPIMAIIVSGRRSAREITEIADKKIKRPLETVKDIGAISMVGDRKREIQITINPERLNAHNLSIQQVKDAIRKQNIEVPGGRITWQEREEGLRTLGRIEKASDFNDLIVADFKGGPVRIKDIGTVIDGEIEPRTISRLDGNSAVSLLVRKQSGTNTVQVVEKIKERLNEIKASLPQDIQIQVVRDQSRFIKRAISEVNSHLIEGGILASVIVLLFIRNLRTAMIAAVAIPSSIIATFTAMRYMGYSLNNMTMLALSVSIGIVIDDAIIVIENIFRHMEEEKEPPLMAAINGTKEIALAVMATTLSLVVIFLPVAFMSGLVGRFWQSFGITATFSIGISLLVAFTLTPMLSSRFLKPPAAGKGMYDKKGASGIYGRFERMYENTLEWSLHHRLIVSLLALLLFLSPFLPKIGLFNFAKVEFVVEDDMSEFEVIAETSPGSSIAKSAEILKQIEDELKRIPEVVHLFTTIGVRGAYMSNVTDGSIYVELKHIKERKRTQAEIMQEARKLLKKFSNLRISVQQISLISGGGFKQTPFNLAIRGPDMDKLDDYADKIIKKMSLIPGFVDVDTGQALRQPETQVKINRAKASDLGVRVEDIASSLRTMVGGERVSFYREADEQYDVRLRLMGDYRKDTSVISQLYMPARGRLISLNNAADLTSGISPGQIDRYNQERQTTIISNLYNKPLGEAVSQATAILKELNMPPEYSFTFLGRGKLMAEAFKNFMIAFVLSLIFIYMVLAAQFESFTHPLTIMVSIFLSIPFGILSLMIGGSSVNIYSIMGLFILIGVVKKNAILQVDYTNTLRAKGIERYEAQIEADRARLRPILMTTFAIIAGMLPVALARGDGSSSRGSMAIVVVGGQALCLFVTLIVTPVVYSLMDDLGKSGVFSRLTAIQPKIPIRLWLKKLTMGK
ncbi:MAG: efflux RND transporter permease subunit [Nitrospirae bacterium]|nr:efflux RND transporter permease subunit [Nitrospirota bacterium]